MFGQYSKNWTPLNYYRSEESPVHEVAKCARYPFRIVWRSISKTDQRMQLAPNSQAGCERSNSKYERYKNKYSSRMGLEIIRARARAGENGPPLPQFPASKARQFWEDNNHRLALKIDGSSDSLVLKRRRKISQKKYTSRIFIDLN